MTYSSTLSMGRQRYAAMRAPETRTSKNPWGKNQNTVGYRERDKSLGPVTNTIVLIVMACLVGLLYLTQVTKTNAYSYKLNDLKDQQTSLQAEHDQLTIDSARLQSQERVKNSDVAKNMVTLAPAATVAN